MIPFLATARTFLTGNCRWLAICAAVAAVAWLHGCSTGKDMVQARLAAANLKAEQEARRADSLAADQRLRDAKTIGEFDDALTEAIMSAPDGKPDPASVALGCERLRQAGTDISRITACQ